MQLPDPRSEGSGNPGATNAAPWQQSRAGLTLAGDVLKGVFVLVARWLSEDPDRARQEPVRLSATCFLFSLALRVARGLRPRWVSLPR